MTTTMATTEQMVEIRHRRITDVAREMMAIGVRLTWAQRDEIGDEGSDWIRQRLGLSEVTTDEDGVSYAAREVMCTGCGERIREEDAEYLDHADTYSGTVWHCARCAAVCQSVADDA